MRKFLLFACVTTLFLSACQQNKKQAYFEPWISIELDNQDPLLKGACFNCLVFKDGFEKDGNNYLTFLDYKPGMIYLYNNDSKKFESKFNIPKEPDTGPAQVMKVYNLDSIVYFNNSTMEFVSCDSARIKSVSKAPGLHDQLDSAMVIEPIKSRLRQVDSYFLFDTRPIYSKKTAPFYYDLKNSSPFLGLFEVNNFSFRFHYIPILDPAPEYRQRSLLNHFNLFDVDPVSKVIYFQNKCMNDLYAFDLKSYKTKKIDVQNSSFKIEPIYVSNDPYDPEVMYAALDKQNFCIDLFYSHPHKVLIRYFSIVKNKERTRYYQFINADFKVISEIELPEDYLTEFQTKDDFIRQRYDPKTKTIILEKLNFKF